MMTTKTEAATARPDPAPPPAQPGAPTACTTCAPSPTAAPRPPPAAGSPPAPATPPGAPPPWRPVSALATFNLLLGLVATPWLFYLAGETSPLAWRQWPAGIAVYVAVALGIAELARRCEAAGVALHERIGGPPPPPAQG